MLRVVTSQSTLDETSSPSWADPAQRKSSNGAVLDEKSTSCTVLPVSMEVKFTRYVPVMKVHARWYHEVWLYDGKYSKVVVTIMCISSTLIYYP